jgi:hypothetical protein
LTPVKIKADEEIKNVPLGNAYYKHNHVIIVYYSCIFGFGISGQDRIFFLPGAIVSAFHPVQRYFSDLLACSAKMDVPFYRGLFVPDLLEACFLLCGFPPFCQISPAT